jgi:CRISPR-associated protein Csx14
VSCQQPSFTVNVDVTNPGQVMACCGLLELAHRLWPGAEGWFEERRFCVSAPDVSATLKVLIDHVLGAQASPGKICGVIRGSDGKPVDPNKVIPIEIGGPFNLRLAWWLDELTSIFTPLKLWSGRQSSWDVFRQLRDAGKRCQSVDERIFDAPAPLKSRFGLDPRSAWEALDTGFSPNTLDMTVATFWATELLATIGLASFVIPQNNFELAYTTWPQPLPVAVARIAVAGLLPITGQEHFKFRLVKRGSFDGFDFAYPIGGDV